MPEPRERSIVATSYALLAANVVTGGALARILGPEGRGTLAAVQAPVMIVATIGALGLPAAVAFHAANRRAVLSTSIVLVALHGTFCFGVLYAFLPVLLRDHGEQVISGARVFASLTLTLPVLMCSTESLRGRGLLRQWNVARTFPATAWLLAVAVAALVWDRDARSVAVAYALLLAIGATVCFIVALRDHRPEQADVRKIYAYALPSALALVPHVANMRLDQVFLIRIVDSADLGLYAVAVAIGAIVPPVCLALGQANFSCIRESSDAERLAIWGDLRRKTTRAATAATSIAVFAAYPATLTLFGRDYIGAVLPAMVLSVGAGLSSVGFVAAESARACGHPRKTVLPELLGAVVGVAAAVGLASQFGILGAAIGSLLGYGLSAFLLHTALERTLHGPISVTTG